MTKVKCYVSVQVTYLLDKIFGNLTERCHGRFPAFRGFQSTKCIEKLLSTSKYIGKQPLFFNFEENDSPHPKPPVPNRAPPPPSLLGGYYIVKNHFLQN